MNQENQFVLDCQELANSQGASFVFARFEKIDTFTRVMLDMPGENNERMRFVPEHQIMMLANNRKRGSKTFKKPQTVKDHYKQLDFFNTNKAILTRNFFVPRGFVLPKIGGRILADVTVVKKINHRKNDEESLILDVKNITLLNGEVPREAEYRMRFGRENGNYEIPNSGGKFITFNKMGGK